MNIILAFYNTLLPRYYNRVHNPKCNIYHYLSEHGTDLHGTWYSFNVRFKQILVLEILFKLDSSRRKSFQKKITFRNKIYNWAITGHHCEPEMAEKVICYDLWCLKFFKKTES